MLLLDIVLNYITIIFFHDFHPLTGLLLEDSPILELAY